MPGQQQRRFQQSSATGCSSESFNATQVRRPGEVGFPYASDSAWQLHHKHLKTFPRMVEEESMLYEGIKCTGDTRLFSSGSSSLANGRVSNHCQLAGTLRPVRLNSAASILLSNTLPLCATSTEICPDLLFSLMNCTKLLATCLQKQLVFQECWLEVMCNLACSCR